MSKKIAILLVLLILLGCEKYIRSDDISRINSVFEIERGKFEQDAHAGRITWVQAVTQTRDLDKFAKVQLDAKAEHHNWRYDSGDEEYYAYCIAIAEKLDKNEISYAQFDAERKRAFNQIEARRQGLENQQELLENTRPRVHNCITEKVFDKYETKCF